MSMMREAVELWKLGLWFIGKWIIMLVVALTCIGGGMWVIQTLFAWSPWIMWSIIGIAAGLLGLTFAGMAEMADREAAKRKAEREATVQAMSSKDHG